MTPFKYLALLTCACVGAAPVLAKQQSSPVAQQTPTVIAAIPTYPNTPAGLEKLMKEMLNLEKRGDAAALAPYLQSLVLPNADAWFKSVFGNKWGAKLARNYESANSDFSKTISKTLGLLAKDDNDARFMIVSFDGSCGPQATQQEFTLLLFRRKKTPLYSVRYGLEANPSSLRMFAYADGGFRYIGNPRGEMGEPAKANGPRLKVLLSGAIGTDGVLRNLRFESGPCWLKDLAERSAKSYNYRSAGAVIDTTLTIIFTVNL